MTHPTIEAALNAYHGTEAGFGSTQDERARMKESARVILSAEPSDAEVEAAARTMWNGAKINGWLTYVSWDEHLANYNTNQESRMIIDMWRDRARHGLPAAYAQRLNELTEKGEV